MGFLLLRSFPQEQGTCQGFSPYAGITNRRGRGRDPAVRSGEGSLCIGLGLRHHPFMLRSAGRGRQQGKCDRISERK